ncbi:galectin-3 [Denticeps clupeoides]|nr:galectin-3-like [Denticeps clupeoides]
MDLAHTGCSSAGQQCNSIWPGQAGQQYQPCYPCPPTSTTNWPGNQPVPATQPSWPSTQLQPSQSFPPNWPTTQLQPGQLIPANWPATQPQPGQPIPPNWPLTQPLQAQPTQPSWPAPQLQPGQPTQPSWPMQQPGQPADLPCPGTNPCQPNQPGVPVVPPNPNQPGVPVIPPNPNQPGVPVMPTNPTQPAVPVKPPNSGWPFNPGQSGWPGQAVPLPGQWPGSTPEGPVAVPYNLNIPRGIYDKMMLIIAGQAKPLAKMFTINFLRGNDIAFHINPRFNEGGKQVLVRNHREGERWGKEERTIHGPFPFTPGQPFEMKILCTYNEFKVAVNGAQVFEFKHRIRELNQIDRINILQDVNLSSVKVENVQ